ncbi:MAG: hypothetical protein JNL38_20570 [Myxococcales bacterium]|nr:hypothetical protein [Myxococcales bacterium]
MGRHSTHLLTVTARSVALALGAAAAGSLFVGSGCGGAIASEPPPADAGVFDAPPTPTARPDAGPPPKPDAGVPEDDDPWMKGDPGPTTPATVIELGSVPANGKATFEIKPGALGFNVTGAMNGEDFGIKDIESPSGQLVHKDSIPHNGDHDTSSTLFGEIAAAGVPQSNHPKAMPAIESGTWGVTFRAPGPVATTVFVQNTPDGAFHGGALDIHVHLPDGLDVEGDTVSKNHYKRVAGIRDRIDAFAEAIRDLYGLTRGDVTFHLVASRYQEIDDDELADAFALSKVATGHQALHVVFSQASRDQQWWGIAGGIPGTPRTGTSQSAIALAMDDRADALMEGYVLAHEAGHFMGLSHTTEFENRGYDPLEDTPQCPNMTFNNFPSCPDYTNVMAAAGALTRATKVSPLQRRVVQGSPLYRAFVSGDPPPPKNARAAPDFGKLFGHPGVPPTAAEAVVLASLCGHVSAGRVVAYARAGVPDAELRRIADDAAAAPSVRRAAARLLRAAPKTR